MKKPQETTSGSSGRI